MRKVVVKPEVMVYFGLLLVKSEFWVAESEKRVAAIFLFPVWPLEPPRRSFLPHSGLYCRGIAHRRLEMLSIRKPGAANLNLWPESTIQKPEVRSKVPEMVRSREIDRNSKNVVVKPEVDLQNRKYLCTLAYF